jgi:DNA-binding response OmpR family regulator
MTIEGRRVLVVEDDMLIAHDIADELRSAGCKVLGPAPRLEAAVALAEANEFDAAVLDVFLDGAYVWTLAGLLAARAVPFIFLTGFGRFLEFPASFASVRCLEKPLRPGALKRELNELL